MPLRVSGSCLPIAPVIQAPPPLWKDPRPQTVHSEVLSLLGPARPRHCLQDACSLPGLSPPNRLPRKGFCRKRQRARTPGPGRGRETGSHLGAEAVPLGVFVRATAPRGRWSCSCRFPTKGRRLWGHPACAPNKDGCTWRGYARRAGGGGSPAPVSPRTPPPPGLRPVGSSQCHNRQQMFSDEPLGEDTASATLSVGHPQTSPIRLKAATLQTPRFRAGDRKSCRSQQPQ